MRRDGGGGVEIGGVRAPSTSWSCDNFGRIEAEDEDEEVDDAEEDGRSPTPMMTGDDNGEADGDGEAFTRRDEVGGWTVNGG